MPQITINIQFFWYNFYGRLLCLIWILKNRNLVLKFKVLSILEYHNGN